MPSTADAPNLSGYCRPEWDAVRSCFIENFSSLGEVGASVCIYHGGEKVVDLSGGWTDATRKTPWTPETLTLVFSATKPATALCAHLLADRGEIDLQAPVSHYWSGFAGNGKDKVTVAMLLDHSAGVPGFREPLKTDAYLDWDYMVQRIEAETPFWEPGTRQGYHMMTFGWTVGELVRRVSGKRLGAFFHDEIAVPLGLDFWIGLPSEHSSRVAPMLPPVIDSENLVLAPVEQYLMENPDSLAGKVFSYHGDIAFFPPSNEERSSLDTPPYHAAEIGGAGGITNARGLAGMYNPLANGGGGLFSQDAIRTMSRISMATHCDAISQIPTRYALGFFGRLDNRHLPGGDNLSLLIGERAFGHTGAGGSLGFADPECGLSFGYNLNQMGRSQINDPRAQALVEAAYGCVEAIS
jgi:CubicO group peptidase (beta-lactamase class C family)